MFRISHRVRPPTMLRKSLLLLFVFLALSANNAFGQTTEFTYQGMLDDGGGTAVGSYDFEFRLFSVETGGAAIGTVQRLGVTVSSGIFAVNLDFPGGFDGTARWLEVAVKPAGSLNPFINLTPRQPMTSAPYSIRSLNSTTADTATDAQQLGGVAANQFVQTNDARLSDARSPTAGSANYIRNGSSVQVAQFNVRGSGIVEGTLTAGVVNATTLTGGVVNATTQYDIGGDRVLSVAGISNVFAGVNAGAANTTGSFNSFFGTVAGNSNTTGVDNSFFGTFAGNSNTGGGANSFFGRSAGFANTEGHDNSFFGRSAGTSNTEGHDNSFFGRSAGSANTAGDDNSFFGGFAGTSNTTGFDNSFFGRGAGGANTSGFGNSFFGRGAGADTTGSNNSFFGALAGLANTTGITNSFFGSSAGFANTSGDDNSFFGRGAGGSNTTGRKNTIIGRGADVGSNNLSFATAIGSEAVVSNSNRIVLGRADGSDIVQMPGSVLLQSLGLTGGTALCRNAGNFISFCSSSLRYKTNIGNFNYGLALVKRLKPITFDWKDGGMHDLGLGAEDVAAIEPLLITYNDKGQVEGVKYDRISVVLINAVKEQQAQIEAQQKQIEQQRASLQQQQSVIDGLKQIACAQNPTAAVCR